jgi:hypothetical protein
MIRIAFSGRLRAGKDFSAAQSGLAIVGFADPIYVICRHFTGSADKAIPGMRPFMQAIGQWGWGAINEKYPITPERLMWIDKIRHQGPDIFRNEPLFQKINWDDYGRVRTFWVDIMLNRPDMRDNTYAKTGVGIVNARFDHEFAPLIAAGFRHFHVQCSNETRLSRIEHYDAAADTDTSEQMAIRLDREAPDNIVIWNDTAPQPSGRELWTVDGFCEWLETCRNPPQPVALNPA